MTLQKFRNISVVPPSGYYFDDPHDGYHSIAATFSDLVKEAVRHRKANDTEIPSNFAEIIEDFLCSQNPSDFVDGKPKRSPDKRVITGYVTRQATSILMNTWVKMGRHVVSQKIADERAEQCSTCVMNLKSTACASCQGLNTWVQSRTGRSTAHDAKLRVCRVSAIMCLAHVHIDKNTLQKVTPEEVINASPADCWKKKLLTKEK